VIPNSGNIQPHGENLPKIIFESSGEIIALGALQILQQRISTQVLFLYTIF
jgi:hypothetical protein